MKKGMLHFPPPDSVTTLPSKQQRRTRIQYTTTPDIRFARHVW